MRAPPFFYKKRKKTSQEVQVLPLLEKQQFRETKVLILGLLNQKNIINVYNVLRKPAARTSIYFNIS